MAMPFSDRSWRLCPGASQILYAGADIWNLENKSTHHYTMIFNTFVWFQIFNEINMRQVTNRGE